MITQRNRGNLSLVMGGFNGHDHAYAADSDEQRRHQHCDGADAEPRTDRPATKCEIVPPSVDSV
jgi:hypothetical protein